MHLNYNKESKNDVTVSMLDTDKKKRGVCKLTLNAGPVLPCWTGISSNYYTTFNLKYVINSLFLFPIHIIYFIYII